MKEENVDGFSERMREVMHEKHLPVKTVGQEVGASSSAMSSYATGKMLPSLNVAVRIARLLGVSLDWLCGLSGDRHLDTAGSISKEAVMHFLRKLSINDGEPCISSIKAEKDDELSICIKGVFSSEKIDELSSLYRFFQKGALPLNLYILWFDNAMDEVRVSSPQ